jgi:hypothetical protein
MAEWPEKCIDIVHFLDFAKIWIDSRIPHVGAEK